jgi:heme exporter protein D
LSTYLEMGGYAAFVWPAYGISIATLAAMIVATLRAYARAKAKVAIVSGTGS